MPNLFLIDLLRASAMTRPQTIVQFSGQTSEGHPSRFRAIYGHDELGDPQMLPCQIEGRYRTAGGHDARFSVATWADVPAVVREGRHRRS